jgi:hypothetical protein
VQEHDGNTVPLERKDLIGRRGRLADWYNGHPGYLLLQELEDCVSLFHDVMVRAGNNHLIVCLVGGLFEAPQQCRIWPVLRLVYHQGKGAQTPLRLAVHVLADERPFPADSLHHALFLEFL